MADNEVNKRVSELLVQASKLLTTEDNADKNASSSSLI
jgi:hypothetical protein